MATQLKKQLAELLSQLEPIKKDIFTAKVEEFDAMEEINYFKIFDFLDLEKASKVKSFQEKQARAKKQLKKLRLKELEISNKIAELLPTDFAISLPYKGSIELITVLKKEDGYFVKMSSIDKGE